MSESIPHVALSPAPVAPVPVRRKLPLLPVAELLDTQQTLTAVERFSRLHDADEMPRQAKYYRDLIPLERPGPGQQYAFEVDLDRCSGCKACVAACHSLNGLDENEVFRTVGLLHGGTPNAPVQQTVTTACHHCLEPACMHGCPVQAYEKDPVTGIVKHLDDQCIGCQYCTLMCPYDAPKYNKALGIVRKCDMCSDRLAHGEAPACVQACPSQAIAVRVVEHETVLQTSEAHAFLPGAPAPEHTLPTTVYKSQKPMPANLLPADFYATSPEHSHPPLVIMLTVTQFAIGAFGLGLLVERLSGSAAGNSLAQAGTAIVLALLALGASIFHLGRPLHAWRAFLGVRTSWMSREILTLGLFVKLAIVYAVLVAAPLLPDFPGKALLTPHTEAVQVAAALAGALGVFCSVMVYVATGRAQWSATPTGIKFFGTAIVLGASSVLAVGLFSSAPGAGLDHVAEALLGLVLAASGIKLALDASLLGHARDRQLSTEKRVARVMLGDLRAVTGLRLGLSLLGGILLPALLLGTSVGERPHAAVLCMLVLLLGGEIAERVLFFQAAPASRMPGGLR
jgi:formate dehydrogenase iron-sulfur subunit